MYKHKISIGKAIDKAEARRMDATTAADERRRNRDKIMAKNSQKDF